MENIEFSLLCDECKNPCLNLQEFTNSLVKIGVCAGCKKRFIPVKRIIKNYSSGRKSVRYIFN